MQRPNKIFVVDTETTGLPPRGANPALYATWDNCRVVQIAWHIYDEHGNLEEKKCFMIKPTFQIPAKATEIHGITQDMAEREGVPMWKVLELLKARLPLVAVIVAHNLEFDKKVILAEMSRYNDIDLFNEFGSKTGFCTMLKNTVPGQRWPKLVDLYNRVISKPVAGQLHQADTDVQLCAEIYFATK